ncbi:MAG: hypothetical protein HY822_19620 [Acidobacteria bacterium]|nr:hypothetical protein [Acidobacteriota bacterium]
MNYSRKIVCLANSRKPSGRCVAGREVIENGYGGWIRPVSVRPSAEINLEERRYENGRDPQVLDLIGIPMIAPVPRVHQTENHMIDAEQYWIKEGSLAWADLPALVETPGVLWLNEDSTHHGTNDCVSQASAARLTSSLLLIKPQTLNVQVQTEGGVFGPAKKRVRADFRYNGTVYNFVVTDPVAELAFLARGEGVFPLDSAYLCVSLTEAYERDGRCHKLVAAIIREQAL